MSNNFSFGVDTFAAVNENELGELDSHGQVIRNVVEQGVLADEVGLEVFAVGEHHRPDYAASSPEIILAAVAARTNNIILSTAVTVLSSDDPVRVFQRFSTLAGVSNNRAEVMLGRGSFIESFPLFGFDLADYEQLFNERLDLFSKIVTQKEVTGEGKTRAALKNQRVYPETEKTLPIRIAVGGSPESVVRAAKYGFPLSIAIIGGAHERFAPYSNLYLESLERFEQEKQSIGVHSLGHVAETDEKAIEQLWPYYRDYKRKIGSERGWPAPTFDSFMHEAKDGSLLVGSPETVAKKVAKASKLLHADRFTIKYDTGTMPQNLLLNSIELMGTKVAPMLKELMSE